MLEDKKKELRAEIAKIQSNLNGYKNLLEKKPTKPEIIIQVNSGKIEIET